MQIRVLIALLLAQLIAAGCQTTGRAPEASWSSVPLAGMHLQLLAPKKGSDSLDLYFGKDGGLALDSCSAEWCTGPATIWKVENNRLKTGFAPTQGDVLVSYSTDLIVLRTPEGTVFKYKIVPKQ